MAAVLLLGTVITVLWLPQEWLTGLASGPIARDSACFLLGMPSVKLCGSLPCLGLILCRDSGLVSPSPWQSHDDLLLSPVRSVRRLRVYRARDRPRSDQAPDNRDTHDGEIASFRSPSYLLTSLLICAALAVGPGSARGQKPGESPRLGDYFGFQPLEIYKLERRIGNLMIRDLDGDKAGDIIVGNNARSRIDLLLSTKRPADEAETRPFRKEVNDLDFDKRMRLVEHSREQGSGQHRHGRFQRRRQA